MRLRRFVSSDCYIHKYWLYHPDLIDVVLNDTYNPSIFSVHTRLVFIITLPPPPRPCYCVLSISLLLVSADLSV